MKVPQRRKRTGTWRTLRLAVVLVGTLLPLPLGADSLLPLVTETVQPLPSGITELTLGLAYARNNRFPFFTQAGALASQDVLHAPQLGLRVGAGGWVEIQASYETIYLHERDSDGQTNDQFGSGDARLFTKVRLFEQRDLLPALGLRFGAKLPNANREDRLGTDATDFWGEVLLSRRFGPVGVHANLGLLLLGVPEPAPNETFTSGGQDDLFSYSVAVVSRPLGGNGPGTTQLTLMGEVAGLSGSHYDNDRAAVQLGLQLRRSAGWVYLGMGTGLISASEDLGVVAGFTYTFDLTRLFGEPSE